MCSRCKVLALKGSAKRFFRFSLHPLHCACHTTRAVSTISIIVVTPGVGSACVKGAGTAHNITGLIAMSFVLAVVDSEYLTHWASIFDSTASVSTACSTRAVVVVAAAERAE